MKSTIMRSVACSLLLTVATSAWGQKFDQLRSLAQGEFRQLSEDVGGALSYHPQAPTEALGITGFDVGASVTMAKLRNHDILKRASSDSVPSYLPIPTLRLNKGLPFGFDVGGLYATVPGSDISFWGLEGRYAFLKGGIAEPAIGIRGSYTKLSGVSQLDMSTKGVDISASKGFLVLTPYIGAGRVWVTSEPHVLGLSKETLGLNKVFVGAGFHILLFNVNAEYDRTGVSNAYSLKASIRF